MKWTILLVFFPLMSNAQSLTGEYYLQGVHETAAGFLLKEDSTFEYFYSEGALDRYAKGKWSSDGKKMIFNTGPAQPSDYKLITKSINPDKNFVVRIVEANKILQRFFFITAFANGVETTLQTNSEGMALFPSMKVDSIRLVFQFCPERSSIIQINGKENWYEFGFEPWLFEIFFSNLEFKIEDNELIGKNPFNEKEGKYLKEGSR